MDSARIISIDITGFDTFPIRSELVRLSDKHSIGFTETHIVEILSCRAETDMEKLSELLQHLTSEYSGCSIELVVLNLFDLERYRYNFLNGKRHDLYY